MTTTHFDVGDVAVATAVEQNRGFAKDQSVAAPSRRICFICTQSFAMRTLYKGLFPYFQSLNFEVHAVTGDDEFVDLGEKHFGTPHFAVIPMKRFPNIADDLMSLVRFYRYFMQNRFDIIHVSTPKASLLVSIAARLAGNGPIIFVYRRCVYQNMAGIRRSMLKAVDRFICGRSSYVLAISRQLRDHLVDERISPATKTGLIGQGSSNGIDTGFFSSSQATRAAGARLRAELGIADGAPVILYLGRILREKGVDLLPAIFARVKQARPDAVLVVAGPDESARDPISEETRQYLRTTPDVKLLDFVADPRPLFELADVFCFPSFFEGYGNVMLEAAAMGVPAVGFDVPGVQEATVHGRTGLLSAFGDVEDMAGNIVALLADRALYERLQADGLQRINDVFAQPAFFASLNRTFSEVMTAHRRGR